jgi:hypothetical protein
MITVEYTPEFVLAAAKLELDKANKLSRELARLGEIGYMYSQTGLDIAIDVKRKLESVRNVLALVDDPVVDLQRVAIKRLITNQNIIISNIELMMELK